MCFSFTVNAQETVIKEEGQFVGMADPHTVAILVNGEEKSFQVDAELMATIEKNILNDDNVNFTYIVQEIDGGSQNILKSIQKISIAIPKTGDFGIIPYLSLAGISLFAIIKIRKFQYNN